MKIAVLADIHANLPALQAVVEDIEAWLPDLVLVAGDIVNRGPLSRACLELVLQQRDERGWRVLRGNHEGYLLAYDREQARPDLARNGPRSEIVRGIDWTHRQLVGLVPAVAALPEQLHLEHAGDRVAVYHASIHHNRDGLYRGASLNELRQRMEPGVTVFCTGHTHVPFVRRVDSTLVVNAGSVGLPFDDDTRAGYARLTHGRAGWRASIRRLRYDLGAAERAFAESGMLAVVGGQAQIMLRELQTARSLLFDFYPAYSERILAGAISVEEAVREFLNSVDRAA